MRRSLMLLSNYGLSHLSLYSCEGYYTNDILSGASTGKIVDRSCDTLKHRTISFCFCKSLNQLVTNVTTVKVREDQYISMSGNFASFCFCLCYGRNDCSIKL